MAKQLTLDLALPPPTYRREDFIVADGNREALAWLDRWPDWPAPALALGGPPGCGKTHLAHIWATRTGAAILQSPAITPAQAQANLGLQYDLVFAAALKLQTRNSLEVHDQRAMNAQKLLITQVALELQQRAPQDVRVAAHVQAGVIAGSLDTVDVRHTHEGHLALTSHHESLCCASL